MDSLIILSMDFQIHKYIWRHHSFACIWKPFTNVTMIIWRALLEWFQVINLSRLSRKGWDGTEGLVPQPSNMWSVKKTEKCHPHSCSDPFTSLSSCGRKKELFVASNEIKVQQTSQAPFSLLVKWSHAVEEYFFHPISLSTPSRTSVRHQQATGSPPLHWRVLLPRFMSERDLAGSP